MIVDEHLNYGYGTTTLYVCLNKLHKDLLDRMIILNYTALKTPIG